MIAPPYTPLDQLQETLAGRGFAILSPEDNRQWLNCNIEAIERLHEGWEELPPDPHLLDGGRYRKRRHACYVVEDTDVRREPDRPHWQPVTYNALHGGLLRHFAPVLPATDSEPAWSALLHRLAGLASQLFGAQPWYVETHPFRIDTTDGIGRPTPEGAHRDGVDLVAVMLMGRHNIKGGESRVFASNRPDGTRFTLDQPGALLILDDHRVIHETTPIQPEHRDQLGWRDTLVITCRAGGFQGPEAS